MAVKLAKKAKNLKEAFEISEKIIHEELSKGLAYLGEECVTRIRDGSHGNDWIDRTSNLRSSIGYVVFDYGKTFVESQFEAVSPEGEEGVKKGREYVEQLAAMYAKTFALVVVAGMDYAEHVENMQTRDVLANTEIYAQKRINDVLATYKNNAEKRINALFKNLL